MAFLDSRASQAAVLRPMLPRQLHQRPMVTVRLQSMRLLHHAHHALMVHPGCPATRASAGSEVERAARGHQALQDDPD